MSSFVISDFNNFPLLACYPRRHRKADSVKNKSQAFSDGKIRCFLLIRSGKQMAKTNNANFSFLAPDIDFYDNKGATKVMYKSDSINLTLFRKFRLSRLLFKRSLVFGDLYFYLICNFTDFTFCICEIIFLYKYYMCFVRRQDRNNKIIFAEHSLFSCNIFP